MLRKKNNVVYVDFIFRRKKLKYKEEYAQPVIFDINRLEQMGLQVIKDNIVTIQNNRVRHDTVVVASIIYNLLKEKNKV